MSVSSVTSRLPNGRGGKSSSPFQSTLRAASPMVDRALLVRRALVVAGLPPVRVAPFSRNTTVSESVCSHTPSPSLSYRCTVYSKVSVWLPEPDA